MFRADKFGSVAVFRGVGQPLEIQTFELPELADGEALVEIQYCTLCRSDLHTISGKRTAQTPLVPGHECTGRLVSMRGQLVDVDGCLINEGDRISWSIIVSCGHCFFCERDLPQKCERLYKYGHQRLDPSRPFSGGLATHGHLAANTSVKKIPDSLSDSVASPANCATATVSAAWRVATGINGGSVAVIGAGMLGLTACAMAQHLGAVPVFVSDIDPHRAESATRFGASHSSFNTINDLTGGRGVDVVLDTSGCPQAIENSLQYLRTGGCLILAGAVYPDRPLSLQAEDIVRRMYLIAGIHNYAPADLSTAVDFLELTRQRYPFNDLVEKEYPLTNINSAVADAMDNNWIRVAVKP